MYRTARPSSDLRSRLLAGSLWALLATAASPAVAETAGSVDVPAGTLDAALTALAGQTHQQVLYKAELVANRRAPAVKGVLTSEEALRRLLQGTGISVKRTGPNVLVLHAASTSTRAADGPATDRPFVGDGAPEQVVGASAGAGATASPPPVVDEVTVTGSNVRGAPPASPLLVVTRADLERSGQTTVADALRALPENFSGGAGEGNSLVGADPVGRNNSFGAGINLRGLGNRATLVLVNGRRLAGSGAFGDYVDVSSIPTAAVQRVEVLLDGASAIYGSDAIGGVVNIVTRKDFEGLELRALAGIGTSGEPAQGQVSVTAGHHWGTGGVMVAYELQRRDRLLATDRDFAATSDLRSRGGSDFRLTNAFPGNVLAPVPGTTAVTPTYAVPPGQNGVGLRPSDFLLNNLNRQNQRIGQDLLPRQTLNSVYVAANQEVTDRLELTGDARFSARRAKGRLMAATSTFTVGRNNPFFVSPNGAASNQIQYSFGNEFPNVTSVAQTETLTFTLGGKLRLFSDWRAEAYGAFGQEITEQRGYNLVNSIVLNEALGNTADNPATAFSTARLGFFNPFSGIPASNPAAIRAAIGSGTVYQRSRSRVEAVNLQADGSLWALPGGPVKLAFGVQARRETLARDGSNFVSTIAPVPTNPTDVSRDVTAVFAELAAPIVSAENARPGIQRLELSLAGRVEHYEGIGTTSNPKIGLVWSPTSDLQLRGTYSRSFRAPALRELYDPETYSALLIAEGVNRVRSLQLSGGNPSLQPETAVSWTVGADFQPTAVPGLRLSLTAFDIRFKDRIDRPVGSSLANALVDPTVAPFVRRIMPGANAADLAYITALITSQSFAPANGIFPATDYGATVDTRYVNTATLNVRGVDASGAYSFDVGENRLRLGASASYLIDYKQQFTPTTAVIERVNVANFPLRLRGRLTSDWTRGRITVGGALNYTGRYEDTAGVRIRAHATVDLQARLAPADNGLMEGVSVLLNVRNVFDRDPPFYNNSVGLAYDAANADPVGRFVSLQLTRAW
ncbi:TonB-dependent receptor [uncultured Phenylobacterium sp.]|uniref:TonB-dependent receptor n=1 Tax=uncultured Phenylobacterium sp. TaxID=349273 RepID=UPI0025E70BF1|nr:TonB-dependent receptor [uncultured Phenylobacterium sp.]